MLGTKTLIIGKARFGKSSLAFELLPRFQPPRFTLYNFDIVHKYSNSIRPSTFDRQRVLENLCHKLMIAPKPPVPVLFIDELQRIVDYRNYAKFPKFADYIVTGGNYGCCFVGATQRPKIVPQDLFANIETYLLFRIDRMDDLIEIKSTLGREVAQTVRNLPRFHYIVCNGYGNTKGPFQTKPY